jgi:ribosomal subunit interface protein
MTTAAVRRPGLKEVSMEIEVHGSHVPVPDDLRRLAAKKTERLSRYLAGMERAQVSFSNTPSGHLGEPISCEVVLEGHGHVVRAVGVGARPTVALDAAVDKAASRLARLKRKLVGRSRPRHGRGKVVPAGGAAVAGSDDDDPADGGAAGDEREDSIEGITEL